MLMNWKVQKGLLGPTTHRSLEEGEGDKVVTSIVNNSPIQTTLAWLVVE